MFYLSWKTQLDLLSDKELRRFIKNLIAWHQDEEIELKSKTDTLVWTGILPALEVNDNKWYLRAGASRENGKLGGRPPKKTQQVIENPSEPVNSKELNVNCEKKMENSKMEIVKGEMINEKSEIKPVKSGQSISEYYKSNISKIENELLSEYGHYSFLIDMANPTGLKELKFHIEKKEELEKISVLLKELAESKFLLRGSY